MENVRILVVEDKSLIAQSIAATLRNNFIEVVGICDSGEDAIELAGLTKPDLILMDVQLNGAIDGISAAKVIMDKFSIPVIYLTDFTDTQTVERAKKTHPVNFLSKPFDESSLIRSIEIAFYNASRGQAGNRILTDGVFIKDKNLRYTKVLYDNILYLRADRAYCVIITEQKTFNQAVSMKHIYEQLDPAKFLRVHRSYVVNLDKVTGVEGNMLFIGDQSVAVSPELRQEVMGQLKFL